MTDRARLWWTRVALLAGAGWLAVRVVWQPSSEGSLLSIGQVTTSYLVAVLPVVVGAVAVAAFALSRRLRQVVIADRFRLKMAVFSAWLPVWLLIAGLGRLLVERDAQAEWNIVFSRLFLALTLAMLLATLDALRAAVRRAEFWMAVAGVVVALGLVEAGMRYWIRNLEDNEDIQLLYDPAFTDPSLLRFRPHHYAGHIPKPGWTSADGLDRINSLGFRGEEIEIPKPDGVYRIVALGGSTTFGTDVSDWRDAYPAQLEQVLRESYGHTNVEVVNGGTPSYSSWETLVSLEFRALDLEPDLVILYQNTNDVHSRIVPPSAYRGDNSGRRKMWDFAAVERASSWPLRVPSVLWRFVAVNLGWVEVESFSLGRIIVHHCSGPAATTSCLGMKRREALEANPPVYYERNVRNIVAVAQANHVDALLLTWAYRKNSEDYTNSSAYRDAFAEHNDVMRGLADELDTYFFDFAAEMPLDEAYWADGRHMTAAGNRVRAELIAAYIEQAGIIPNP